MNMEEWVAWELASETKVLWKILPQRHFIYHRSHMTWPGIEPRSLQWEATNPLSCDVARICYSLVICSFLFLNERACAAVPMKRIAAYVMILVWRFSRARREWLSKSWMDSVWVLPERGGIFMSPRWVETASPHSRPLPSYRGEVTGVWTWPPSGRIEV
jgi:hypothetical protein